MMNNPSIGFASSFVFDRRFICLMILHSFWGAHSFAQIQSDNSGNLFEYTTARMSDDVKIALAVGYPKGFDPKHESHTWPTIFQMSGYQAATKAAPHEHYDGYVTVNASLRGTGASGGKFDVFSERSTRDGYEIIENWIVKQHWSNGKVGIHGHSWPGLTGFRVAATNPPHLAAVVVSGLFDDARRGLTQMGGIRNIGFPVSWASNFSREDGVFGSDEAAIKNRNLNSSEAKQLRDSRDKTQLGDPARQTVGNRRGPQSLRTLASQIRAPTFLLHAYQDQQTGPSGAWLFEHLADDVPKRLLLTNGHHGMPVQFVDRRRAWFDYWLRGVRHENWIDVGKPKSGVEVFFEVQNQQPRTKPPLFSSDFPLPETRWTRYYFDESHRLSTSPGKQVGQAQSDSYRVDPRSNPDFSNRIDYRLDFKEPTALCGPIVVSLWASCSCNDTDFFVVLSDIAPDGRVRPLQRGMLRASQRALDDQRSSWVKTNNRKLMVRPYHTYSDPQKIEPGEVNRFEIEVFPVGHVFRDGHQLVLSIGPPPSLDPVTYPKGKKDRVRSGSFKYDSKQPEGTITIHRSPEYPSSVLLPLLPQLPPIETRRPATLEKLWVDSRN